MMNMGEGRYTLDRQGASVVGIWHCERKVTLEKGTQNSDVSRFELFVREEIKSSIAITPSGWASVMPAPDLPSITDRFYPPPKISETTRPTSCTPHKQSQPPEPMTVASIVRTAPAPSQRQDRLRALEGVPSLQRLPALHAARLDADHVLVAILGRKVADPGSLLRPRVPHHEVGQVVADDREDGLAALGDLDWLTGALGRRVDAICLAGDGDAGRLGLGLQRVDLVDILGGVEALDRDLRDILRRLMLATACPLSYVPQTGFSPYAP